MTSYGPVSPDDTDHDEDGPQGAEWLGHRDDCSLQWSNRCDCNDPIDPELRAPIDRAIDGDHTSCGTHPCTDCR